VPPPTEPPADIPPLLAAERSTLLDLLADLEPDDWHRPTPCPAWDVLDLCTHLVGDDLGVLARHRDGHHGTAPPGDLDLEGLGRWLDDAQRAWVAAARRLSPRLVVDLLAWTGPQVLDVLRDQDPRRLTATVSWAGPDPVPVWLDQGRELSEQWIHRQQLLQALGRPSDLDPVVVRPVLDACAWAYPHQLAAVAAEPGDTVDIEVTGEVDAAWLLVASPAGWDLADEPGGQLVARSRLTTEQAWRLLSGNLPPDEQGRLDITGDEPVVEALRRTRAVIGAVP
jgi:uncharacterized protein (TIGR03083 family)